MKMRILYFHSQQQPLKGFGDACLSLTPKIFIHKDELFLDISVTEKFFKGETNTLAAFEKLKTLFHLEGTTVLTDKIEWARPFRKDNKTVVLPPGKSQSQLFELPIEHLQDCGDPPALEREEREIQKLIAFMKRVGMRKISDFAKLEATAISRRFGKLGILLHQWVLGTREVHLTPFFPSEELKEILDAEDVGSMDSLFFCLEEMLNKLSYRLHGRALVARELKLRFFVESGNHKTHPLKLSEPMRETSSFLKVLRDFLGNKKWDSPLQSLEVEVSDHEASAPMQLSFFDEFENRFSDLSHYVERLRARFGEQSVGFPVLQESYHPERSWKNIWPPSKARTETSPPRYHRLRPLFLYTPPRPYAPPSNWKLIPSENLAAEWWERGGFRRYFIAHTPQGTRLWLFWDTETQKWFLQGTFD
jgi:protein ImuB